MRENRLCSAAALVGSTLLGCAIVLGACGTSTTNNDDVDPGDPFGGDNGSGSGDGSGDGSGGGGGGDGDGSGDGSGGGDGMMPPPPPMPVVFEVHLVPNGVSGVQRVNFAVPLPAGMLTDPNLVRIRAGTTEVPAARRALARYTDGSAMSVQIQVDVDVTANAALQVELGVAGAAGSAMVPVADTLTGSGNTVRPRVWAMLPSDVLAASTVLGPMLPRSAVEGTALDAWADICDYEQWNTDAFLVGSADREVWLFDRVTAMYRGHAITGALSPLDSAYREASIYRAGMTISNGVATAIPVPGGGSSDLKYQYSQGMALHYLFSGDDRFREAAEAVSAKVVTMWNPSYAGGSGFWTERHAGFALLAHEWAARVTDDKLAEISARADAAVTAYLGVQLAARFGQSTTDTSARCFAHTGTAHGETWTGAGCSPWMSAIVADGLDAHARRVGGTRADEVRAALGRLGKIIARDGRDASGRPLYWMGVGGSSNEVDGYDEHWGESAYVVALGWASTGKTDPMMRAAADQLIAGLASRGVVGRIRSFNWQCRSGVMTPALLQ